MSNVEDIISWPRRDTVLSVLDEQKGDDSCGHHPIPLSSPKNTLSTLWVTLT
ncbi:hypothetical protein BU26DRAFT_433806 [Trematosphaeria pertusa]|uniref:Uncharacterized protein n=1 Tax=Trematosphaeria pertusa TaxID=390896 RepID=A0A6A6I5F0_9PLEO|nr:uncharacterized protein BU26DRAFT_433806 [Trematosphaeria pertusa]KAF2245182.1 hypothetical protein BU26DRAFT_433806 [Trematosphaeria pertusa]